jgi:hypothetical protein
MWGVTPLERNFESTSFLERSDAFSPFLTPSCASGGEAISQTIQERTRKIQRNEIKNPNMEFKKTNLTLINVVQNNLKMIAQMPSHAKAERALRNNQLAN